MTTIDAPRTPYATTRKGVNWEKWGWIYMRASGVVLVVLIFGTSSSTSSSARA